MDARVRCKICNETLSYNTRDVFVLGEHLVRYHPENDVSHYHFENDNGDCLRYFECGKHEESCEGGNASKSRSDGTEAKLYKATVETWKEGRMIVKCFNCKRYSRPLLRKQRNKVAATSVGAFWLYGCWPFCVLPFISGKAAMGIRAYCKYCGHFIGTIDRSTGHLIQKCASCTTTEVLEECEC